MRVIIASTYVPFARQSGEQLTRSLAQAVQQHGHQVDIIRLPFSADRSTLSSQTLAIRSLDLSEAAGERIDRLITLRYPSHALRHPNKVSWFTNHYRSAYDWWDTLQQDIPNTPEGLAFRHALLKSDSLYLKEHQHIFTMSKVLFERVQTFNHIKPNGVLYTPLPNSDLFRPGASDDYFLCSAWLPPKDQQMLAVEAMRYTHSSFWLGLIGLSDTHPHTQTIKTYIERYELQNKVRLIMPASEIESAKWVTNACGILYLGHNEDFEDYSILEALHAHKPIVTCVEVGGLSEIVEDGVNGFVVDASPEQLAERMEALFSNRQHALEMGEQSSLMIHKHNIHWSHVIKSLLG